MAEYIEREKKDKSICRSCFHSYVCEKFNARRGWENDKCLFFNDHFVPATLAPRWVSVKERLPELKESVLLYFNEGNMAVGYWFEKDENFTFWSAWTDNGWFSDCDCEPLYWMPLPEPPKREGENDA